MAEVILRAIVKEGERATPAALCELVETRGVIDRCEVIPELAVQQRAVDGQVVEMLRRLPDGNRLYEQLLEAAAAAFEANAHEYLKAGEADLWFDQCAKASRCHERLGDLRNPDGTPAEIPF